MSAVQHPFELRGRALLHARQNVAVDCRYSIYPDTRTMGLQIENASKRVAVNGLLV